MLLLLLLLGINVFFAWRYAPLDIDPDFALFNMAGQVGSWYGKDFVDCKSPLVHIWFWLLSKLSNSLYGVRFIHYYLTGLPGIVYYWITGDFIGAFAFVVLVHSGHLYAFHGNVGDIPAGLILIALAVESPWIAVGLFLLAVLYEPKLFVAFAPWVYLNGLLTYSGAYMAIGIVAAAAIWYYKHRWWDWLVEANITVPAKMNENRKGLYPWFPQFTTVSIFYLGAWVVAAFVSGAEILFLLPGLIYLVFIFFGHVVRPNHLLPLIPFIAASGLMPGLAIGLAAVDFISSGLYIGDIWNRFYPGLRTVIRASRITGEYLKNKKGDLWVNSMFSEIYIWAKKPVKYNMTEQVEINACVPRRRERMKVLLGKNPPRFVVDQPGSGLVFDNRGYNLIAENNYFKVYELMR